MLDVKKLIAGFLILASGASSSVFIFSYLNTAPLNGVAGNSNSSLAVVNAFIPQSETDIALSADVTNNPNNLTGDLTDVLLTGIMNANPTGPTTDADGNEAMASPNAAQLATQLASDPLFKDFKAPDWDAQANNVTLNITKKYSADDVNTYLSSINDIVNKDLIQSGAQTSLDEAMNESVADANSDNSDSDSVAVPDPSTVTAFAPLIADSLSSVVALKTPEPLVGFQKSFIKMLVYENNITQLIGNSSDDPIRTSLTLQSEEKNSTLAMQDFQNQLQDIEDNTLSFNYDSAPNKNSDVFSMINQFFGVPTANAQAVLGVPVNDITLKMQAASIAAAKANLSWYQILWKFAQNLALQALKNVLINFVQNKVLKWVNGSGAPRFITAWADTLINAGLAAANAKLSSLTNNVCPTFGPLINIALTVKIPASPAKQSCTFPATTMKTFMNNFTGGGGWNSYMNMLQPNNNFYSQLMSVSDKVVTTNATQNSASKAQAVAGQGLTGDQVCADGSNPSGSSQYCDGGGAPSSQTSCLPNWTQNGNMCWSNSNPNLSMPPVTQVACPGGAVPLQKQNNGVCADGSSPKVTTPGVTTGFALNKALGSNISLTINAKSIEALAMQMAESLMVALTNTAVQDINKAVNSAGNSGGLTSIASVGTTSSSTASSTPVSCSPTTQNTSAGSPAFINALNGANDADGNPPTYTWTAPGSDTPTSTGYTFTGTYDASGTYNVMISASTDNSTSTCQVIVQ